MVDFSLAIILVGLSLIVGGWVPARSVAYSLATMRFVPYGLMAAGTVIALSRLSSIDPGWKIVTLAGVAGSVGLAIMDIRRRREADYHARYPVFTSKPVRSIIGLNGSLRQLY